MRGSRTVSTIACASVQASWTLGNCFLNMFLNMVDTLVGAGVYRTLSLGRAHPLPGDSFLLYTHYVRSATQFDALKRAQTIPCLNNGRPSWVKTGKALCEHMFSALLLKAHIRSAHL